MFQNPEVRKFIDSQNRIIVKELAPLWFRNVSENEPIIRRQRNVAELFGKGRDIPAVLVASGPSLDRNIGLLKEVRDRRALIIACDSAYHSLLNAGVRPHVLVALDPKPQNARFYDGTLEYQKSTLFVCATLVHRDVINSWRYPVYFFNPTVADAEVEFFDVLPYIVGNLGVMSVGGHVFSAVLMLAAFVLQCRPILMVGADYCWYDDQHHVSGASVAKFVGNVEETSDLFGRRAYQNDALRLYHTWSSEVLAGGVLQMEDGTATPVVNCTEGGMLQPPGLAVMPLRYAIDRHLKGDHGDLEDKLKRAG